MKALKVIMKLVAALAAVAGAIYVLATYGETITAWCRKILDRLPCKQDSFQPVTISFTNDEDDQEDTQDETVEAEEAPEAQPEEAQVPTAQEDTFAQDTDFVLPCDLAEETADEEIPAEEEAPQEELPATEL